MIERWDITLPLLRFTAVKDNGTITTSDARNALVKELKISQDEQDKRMKGGHNKLQNEVRWAFQELKFAGLLVPVERGVYRIAAAGRAIVENPPPRVDYKYLIDHTDYKENLRRAKSGQGFQRISDILVLGEIYSRKRLQDLIDTSGWGFDTGVFMAKLYKSICLFVTEEKTPDRTQYFDLLRGDILDWDGQKSGRTDDRILNYKLDGNELLLFYRKNKNQYPGYGFRFEGPFEYESHSSSRPTHFILRRDTSLVEDIESDLEGLVEEQTFVEGRKRMRWTSSHERNPKLREAAIRHHGTTCTVCGFDFEDVYGPHGRNYIEVHHIVPISDSPKESIVDPKKDMTVVCANCHRIIHRRRSYVLSISELRSITERYKTTR